MGLERRRSIARAAGDAGVLLIEDEPYAELRYSGNRLPALRSFDPERIAYLGTCSKTVAPGLRVGWVAAEPALLARLVLAKQGMDLHTSTLSQRALHRYLTTADVDAQLGLLRREYGRRRDVMAAALRARFPPGIAWTDPQGGMFIWVRLPASLDAGALLEEAVARKVAYVPGAPFFPDGGGQNHLRLNFSNAPQARIDEGIARLAEVIARAMTSGGR
jgi:2-aminoadipate transaminase